MSDAKPQQEPTMEEILASIRRIISEDGTEGAPEAKPAEAEPVPAKPPVLELTEELKEDGSVVSVTPPAPEPPPTAPAAAPEPPPTLPPSSDLDDVELVSAPVASAAAAQLSALAGAVSATRSVPLGNGDKTLEDIVRELLRPMLKQWLDANLQPIVQRIVEREVAKLSSRADIDRFR